MPKVSLTDNEARERLAKVSQGKIVALEPYKGNRSSWLVDAQNVPINGLLVQMVF